MNVFIVIEAIFASINTFFQEVQMSEYFVDVSENPIPPADTWDNLSTDQLIEVKNRLSDNLWKYSKVPAMARSLKVGIARLEHLIQQRLSP